MGVAEHEMIYATASVCLKCRLLQFSFFFFFFFFCFFGLFLFLINFFSPTLSVACGRSQRVVTKTYLGFF